MMGPKTTSKHSVFIGVSMKVQNALLLASVALATIFSATGAQAGGSVSASASVSVTILAPVTLQATQVLDFGAVIKPGNTGANTVAIDPSSEYSYMGSVRGDCAVLGPRRGNPKSESGMIQVALTLRVERRSDSEASEASEHATKHARDAATKTSNTTSESTDTMIRTCEGVGVRRVVGRMSIAASGADPKYVAAMKNLGYLPSASVRYTVHAPDGVTDLVGAAQLHGVESEIDLAELDRIITSIRFDKIAAALKASHTPPHAVR